jgi:hypothetical protein
LQHQAAKLRWLIQLPMIGTIRGGFIMLVLEQACQSE